MAQTGYTPIQLYHSTTATNAPSAGNLLDGELAINTADGKLFYKDNGGVVQVIGWKTVPVTAGGTGATSASSARTNLGATTVGSNLFTLTNPSAITFPQFNADNTVSALSASAFRTAIGAGTGSGDMVLASAQSVTGAKTFDPTALLVKGSSTGATTLTTNNASATNYTVTIPAATDTVALLAAAQTLSAKTWTGESVTTVAKGNSGTTTQTYDYSAGTLQTSTATGNHTIAFSNFPGSGKLGVIQIILTNGGAFTLTWPTINWIKPDGTLTTSISTYLSSLTGRTALQSSGTDQFLFWTIDGGTTVYGKII